MAEFFEIYLYFSNPNPVCIGSKSLRLMQECIKSIVRLPTCLFYIERDPRSRIEIGERDTQLVRMNEAMVA